ncbi:hypothetical protein F5Y10DRAFT_256102 [Nemania abortiva]|nr:hypothetical protein F5Y10DRAFT_256102 [Nemania abortiva]
MAEIPNSDTPSPYPPSTIPSINDDLLARYGDLPSDVSSIGISSILEDSDAEEGEDDDDISIDSEEEEDEDEDEDEESDHDDLDEDDEIDHEGLDLLDEDDEDDYFDDFGFGIRGVGLNFDPLGLMDDDDLPGDYLDFPDEQIDALQHAFLHELEHHFAQEQQWAFRARSPAAAMDQHHGGAGGGRPRMQRDQLVRIEMVAQGSAQGDGGASNRGGGGGGGGAVNSNGNGASAGGGAAGGSQRGVRPRFPNFIDLTGDDDDADMPVQPNAAGQSNHPGRSVPHRQSGNQRRLRSQPQNAPPRLNRSDGNYIDNNQLDVIVLSSSDDEDQPMRNMPRRGAQNNRHGLFNNQNNQNNQNQQNPHLNRINEINFGARNVRFGDQLRQPGLTPAPAPAHAQAHGQNPNSNGAFPGFAQFVQNIPLFQFLNPAAGMMANRNQMPDDDVVVTGERNVGNLPNLGPIPGQRPFLGPIHLDYAARPFNLAHPHPPNNPGGGGGGGVGGGGGPAKPAHQPPKPARPGFTRDTGEDVVAICPSCDQELAYDPEGDDDTPATPAKKSRSKKATAEHHFWAVKACGHVYCKRCFDNRRPSARSAVHVGFRPEGDGGKKIFCAVEDCDSEVSAKGAWVGIFM